MNLRPICDNDTEVIFELARDKEISQYTRLPHPYFLKHAKAYIREAKRNLEKKKAYYYAIDVDGKVVGTISLMHLDLKNRSAELGYWIGKKYWNKGYATDAVKQMLDFAFNELNLNRVSALCMHPNKVSIKILEKHGFKLEGRLRKSSLKEDIWLDDLVYGKLKGE